MKKIFLFILALMLTTQIARAQSFDATVNRTTVPEGETFVLTLELKDVDTSATPDLNALNKDFTVLSISNGYRTNIINGNVSKSRQWNLVLIPNKNGSLTIPSIKLDGYQTQPIILNIVPAGAADQLVQSKAVNTPRFKISGDIDNTAPYVQQQLNYRLTIYDAGGLQGEAPFFVTDNDDWIIKSLGEPQVETKIVNGQTLREITFNYALFAQRSGDLTVPPVRFNGYYLTKETRTDPFARFFDNDPFFASFGVNDVFASRTPVVLNTKPIKVNVRPAKVDSGWWLPAEEVKISAEFESGRPQFKVGEAVSRTIYLKAAGFLDNQLPEIKFAEVNGVKQYPEKPQTDMKVENGKVVSYARITNVYIPEQGGEIILPEIKIDWFNTAVGQTETAVIPAYHAEVAANMQPSVPPVTQPQTTLSPVLMPAEPSETVTTIEQVDNTRIIGYLLAAFIGGIVLTLLLLKLFAFTKKPSANHKKAVLEAAKTKDLQKLRDELLLWSAAEFPRHKVANLQDVADIFQNAAFNKELDKLREALYAETAKDWDNKTFTEIFRKISKQAKKQQRRKTDEPLPKLYK